MIKNLNQKQNHKHDNTVFMALYLTPPPPNPTPDTHTHQRDYKRLKQVVMLTSGTINKKYVIVCHSNEWDITLETGSIVFSLCPVLTC